MQLSKHFTLAEFMHSQTAVRNNIRNAPNQEHILPMQHLCEKVLEPIREHFGVVVVSSGYRSRELNEFINGSLSSQHSKGEAADLMIPNTDPLDVCQWCIDNSIPFDQLIYEGRWTHISHSLGDQRGEVLTAHFQPHQPTRYTKGLD